jgi:hypothetical protein
MDGEFATKGDLRRVERKYEELEKEVKQFTHRLVALEAKHDTTASFRTVPTPAPVHNAPSRSEILTAISARKEEKKDEPKNPAIEVLKIVGPWVLALLVIIERLIERVLEN